MCNIDLEKAFDRTQLEDVTHLIYDREYLKTLLNDYNRYKTNTIQARINGELT